MYTDSPFSQTTTVSLSPVVRNLVKKKIVCVDVRVFETSRSEIILQGLHLYTRRTVLIICFEKISPRRYLSYLSMDKSD